jgi:hypothetical protein
MLNSPRRYHLPRWLIALLAIPIVADSVQTGVRYYVLIFGAAAIGLNCYSIRHHSTPKLVVIPPYRNFSR